MSRSGAADVDVLEPLREEEQELDGLIAHARAAAEKTIKEAEGAAQELRERARGALGVEIQAFIDERARRRAETAEDTRVSAEKRLAALRETAAARREGALAFVLAKVLGELT